MSDSESDDDFMSADEGDEEEINDLKMEAKTVDKKSVQDFCKQLDKEQASKDSALSETSSQPYCDKEEVIDNSSSKETELESRKVDHQLSNNELQDVKDTVEKTPVEIKDSIESKNEGNNAHDDSLPMKKMDISDTLTIESHDTIDQSSTKPSNESSNNSIETVEVNAEEASETSIELLKESIENQMLATQEIKKSTERLESVDTNVDMNLKNPKTTETTCDSTQEPEDQLAPATKEETFCNIDKDEVVLEEMKTITEKCIQEAPVDDVEIQNTALQEPNNQDVNPQVVQIETNEKLDKNILNQTGATVHEVINETPDILKPDESDKETTDECEKPKEDWGWSVEESTKDSIQTSTDIEEQSNQNNEESKASSSVPVKDDWGWDSWADDFIMQTASKVSTLLETVEGQLGIPDPVEMAKTVKKSEEENRKESKVEFVEEMIDKEVLKKDDQISGGATGRASSWFSSFVPVTTLTNLVQNTGTDLMTGGIDALEYLGKKTVNILSEGDPGLRSKRNALISQKTTLSSVLQEARVKNEQYDRSNAALKGEDPAKFNDMFEKFQGVAHLDALEMLSSECETKLERILNVQSDDAKDESTEVLSEIQNRLKLNEDEEKDFSGIDFKKEVYLVSKKLQMKVTCSKLLNTWSKLKEKSSSSADLDNFHDYFEATVSSSAEFLSRVVEYYRKVADMLMLTDMQAKKLATQRAASLKRMADLFENEITSISNTYASLLVEFSKNDKGASGLVTDIYLESSNCSSLLNDSHQLMLPILQLSAIK